MIANFVLCRIKYLTIDEEEITGFDNFSLHIHLSVYLSVSLYSRCPCLSVCLSVCLSLCLSVSLSLSPNSFSHFLSLSLQIRYFQFLLILCKIIFYAHNKNLQTFHATHFSLFYLLLFRLSQYSNSFLTFCKIYP